MTTLKLYAWKKLPWIAWLFDTRIDNILACVAGGFIGVTRASKRRRPLAVSKLVLAASSLTRARVTRIKPPVSGLIISHWI